MCPFGFIEEGKGFNITEDYANLATLEQVRINLVIDRNRSYQLWPKSNIRQHCRYRIFVFLPNITK
jgi:hypothetical protein